MVDHLLLVWVEMGYFKECYGTSNCGRGARVGKGRKRVWAMIPLCLTCIILRERNMRCSEGVKKHYNVHNMFNIYRNKFLQKSAN